MPSRREFSIFLIVIIPVLFALVVRGVFGVKAWASLFSVMTISFIFLLPVAVGAFTIYLSDEEKVKKLSYRWLAPWIPVIIFFLVTLLAGVEGIACWVMVLPLFLVAASIGGLIAGYFKLKKKKDGNVYVSLIAILPFLFSPIEQAISHIPGQYKAYTFIDIQAPKEKIWNNVTRVYTITPEEDKGGLTRWMGFPRPLKAELDFEGVGAYRKAVFDKGLVFDEHVLTYEHQKHMRFSIKANPYDIPSVTMDEHIVVGGEFFDVLDGTYEMEKLTDTTYRLHLYSHFKLATTFNFYASVWARWIMKDIQQNILAVIKKRAEQ